MQDARRKMQDAGCRETLGHLLLIFYRRWIQPQSSHPFTFPVSHFTLHVSRFTPPKVDSFPPLDYNTRHKWK